jgi:hypothetical protein
MPDDLRADVSAFPQASRGAIAGLPSRPRPPGRHGTVGARRGRAAAGFAPEGTVEVRGTPAHSKQTPETTVAGTAQTKNGTRPVRGRGVTKKGSGRFGLHA